MTAKTYLTFGAIVLIIFFGISLTLSVKRCVSWKKQYSELQKERELARRIQTQTTQADERTNQNERTQIHVIRNTPDNALVHELNLLFKNNNQTGVHSPSGPAGTAGSQVPTGTNRNNSGQR